MQAINPEQCAELIGHSRNTVALTGAGISTAAGIPDFRGPQGLYVTRRYDPEVVFDIDYFYRDQKPFYDFTRDFIGVIDGIQPTGTHRFLAELEERGHLSCVITQNIDFLHEKAGSRKLIPLHGSYWQSRCLSCGEVFDFACMRKAIMESESPPCACGGIIKPDVVFFGEQVGRMEEAQAVAARAELMLVIGSSLAVYPAAHLPRLVPGKVVVVNLGGVSLEDAPGRFLAEEDIDRFFAVVADLLR